MESQVGRDMEPNECDAPGPLPGPQAPASHLSWSRGGASIWGASSAKQWSSTANFPSSLTEPSTASTVPGERWCQAPGMEPEGHTSVQAPKLQSLLVPLCLAGKLPLRTASCLQIEAGSAGLHLGVTHCLNQNPPLRE